VTAGSKPGTVTPLTLRSDSAAFLLSGTSQVTPNFWADPKTGINYPVAIQTPQHLVDSVDPIIEAKLHEFIGSDHHITDEVWLEPTPGHTPGHVSVHIRSRGEEAVITCDMMHHPIQLADPEMHGNFDMDKEQGARTRRAFVERYADKRVMIIGTHFCDPTSGWIVRNGDAWQLALE